MNIPPNCELFILQYIILEAPKRLKVTASRNTTATLPDDRDKDGLRNAERLIRTDVEERPKYCCLSFIARHLLC
jgi:hypothetical protein